ncbi:hypothetical protein D1647_20555 [Alistipes sp. Z76]|nr:NigD-like C-terminal domain-containing protein [uncultured Duncaniella sp.]NBJ08550.1 hypothetical protein [Alistipes sp. Z76]NCE70554.1 hypothetical protein [Muribaculaceae bacterium M3]
MNMTRILRHLYIIILLASTLSSCREEGVDHEVDMTCTDIVTFAGNIDGRATFTFNKVDDSPEITLRAQGMLNTGSIDEGSRMLIYYIPENNEAYNSGNIYLRGGTPITCSDINMTWRPEFDMWHNHKVYLYSTWRSGKYINVHVRLTYSTEPRIFCLAVDPGTIDQKMPDVYLVHIISKDVDYHDRAYYASFDISQLWSLPNVEGIRLHVANSNLDKQIFTFAKPQ